MLAKYSVLEVISLALKKKVFQSCFSCLEGDLSFVNYRALYRLIDGHRFYRTALHNKSILHTSKPTHIRTVILFVNSPFSQKFDLQYSLRVCWLLLKTSIWTVYCNFFSTYIFFPITTICNRSETVESESHKPVPFNFQKFRNNFRFDLSPPNHC